MYPGSTNAFVVDIHQRIRVTVSLEMVDGVQSVVLGSKSARTPRLVLLTNFYLNHYRQKHTLETVKLRNI